ncbi:MAG: hypothetical protein JW810_03945 [Sedimentisphaerales bacterium]|nr:hypothetical protein [Sedimentisphaerales bacterium]
MNHPRPEQWMSYLYQESSDAETQELADHLKSCPTCREQLDKWQAAQRQLDAWRIGRSPLAAAGRARWLGYLRWTAAAAVLIAAGYLAGRLGASTSNRTLRQDLQTTLSVAIEADLRDRLTRDWQGALEMLQARWKQELYQQFRGDLNEYAIGTLNATGTQTNKLLTDLLGAMRAAQLEERRLYAGLFDQWEARRIQDRRQLQGQLAQIAEETAQQLAQTQQDVAQLLFTTYGPNRIAPPEGALPTPQ